MPELDDVKAERTCPPTNHNYVEPKNAVRYQKRKQVEDGGSGISFAEPSLSYLSIFCTKCGAVKEIVIVNEKPGE